MVVILCAFGLVLISTKPESYFSASWLKYLLANLSFLNFLQPTLPGVFELNNLHAVNGSLWTLKIEASFYLSVPIFVLLFRRFSVSVVIIAAYILSVCYAIILHKIALSNGSALLLELSHQLPAQLCYFLSGAFFYYKLPFFEKNIHYFLCFAIITLIVNTTYPTPLFEPFSLAVIVIFLSLFFLFGQLWQVWRFFIWRLHITFPHYSVNATCRMHLVEKKFLLRSSHYITTAQ
jgi:peptidoglycan/LPS O-acetylase OafA/YrhL